ncbi:MAG: hypothetical protein ACXWP5_12900, partial [Bdellovibrionota bacterium]
VDNDAKKLATFAHDLNRKGMVKPDSDPTLSMVASILQESTNLAVSALKSGNRHYARSLLRSVPGYCIACHTRNGSGPSFTGMDISPTASSLSAIEQGDFFAATRQFDRALTSFKEVMDAKDSLSRPLDWSRSVEHSLEIAIRVKNDPDQALAIAEKVLSTKQAPFFMKQDAAHWKKAILQWKEELPRRVMTETGLMAEAQRLSAEAHELQRYPADHAADVNYLRASAVLHELLQKFPDSAFKADALLLQGLCYEAFDPSDVVDIHELYYQSCIRQAPHTPTAEACFSRFEQSVFNGYTGSAGTYLPDDVLEKLDFLETMALPKQMAN